MRMVRFLTPLLMLLLLASPLHLFSVADPDWYSVDLQVNPSLLDNSWSIDLNNDNVYLGTLAIEPSAQFISDPTAVWNGNFTLIISSLQEEFRFVRVGDATQYIPYKVFVPTLCSPSGSHLGLFDVPITTRSPAGYLQQSFELSIAQMNHLGRSYTAGDYTSLIKIELIRY